MESTAISIELTLWGKISKFFGNTLLKKLEVASEEEVKLSAKINDFYRDNPAAQLPAQLPLTLQSEQTARTMDDMIEEYGILLNHINTMMVEAREKGLIV